MTLSQGCVFWKHRNQLEISAAILDSLSQKPLRITHIVCKANLDSRSVKNYLGMLMPRGLVSFSDSHYAITEKGMRFKSYFQKLEGLLS